MLDESELGRGLVPAPGSACETFCGVITARVGSDVTASTRRRRAFTQETEAVACASSTFGRSYTNTN